VLADNFNDDNGRLATFSCLGYGGSFLGGTDWKSNLGGWTSMLECRDLCFYRTLVLKIEPRYRFRLLSRERETRLSFEHLSGVSDPVKIQLTSDFLWTYVLVSHFRAVYHNFDY